MLRDSTPPVVTLTASARRTDAESITLTATSEAGAQLAIEGQAAVMLARALKLASAAEPLPLTDADAIPSWTQAQVAALVKAGIIHGRSDGSFDPQAGVTRAELAVMIAGSLHHLGHTATLGTATLTDADQLPQWATGAIQTVTTMRLMVGYETGTFGPANATTRAEVAALLDRMLTLR